MTAEPLAETAPVEQELALDMVRHGLWAAPAFVAFGAVGWGWDGVLSALFALALVFANFLAAAALLGWAAKKGPNVLMATAFVGFAVRMGLVALALWLVKDQAWVADWPLGLTLLVAYLGLLFWETRYVSASLAFPGLKPTKGPSGPATKSPGAGSTAGGLAPRGAPRESEQASPIGMPPKRTGA
jgi:hypothetical protein